MWIVHVPSRIWDLKTASDAAHYLREEGTEPCWCLSCSEQFHGRVLAGDVLVSLGSGDEAGGAAESKTHPGLSQRGETLLLGDLQGSSGSMLSPDGSRWVRLGLWKWINPPVGPLHHSVSSLPESSPLFPGLICTKERRALASQLLYYGTIKAFKDYLCVLFHSGWGQSVDIQQVFS